MPLQLAAAARAGSDRGSSCGSVLPLLPVKFRNTFVPFSCTSRFSSVVAPRPPSSSRDSVVAGAEQRAVDQPAGDRGGIAAVGLAARQIASRGARGSSAAPCRSAAAAPPSPCRARRSSRRGSGIAGAPRCRGRSPGCAPSGRRRCTPPSRPAE